MEKPACDAPHAASTVCTVHRKLEMHRHCRGARRAAPWVRLDCERESGAWRQRGGRARLCQIP